MTRNAAIILFCGFALVACGPDIPVLDARIDGQAGATDYPELVPLGPLLAGIDATPVRSAAGEGESLEARVADLRRRAARLRAVPL